MQGRKRCQLSLPCQAVSVLGLILRKSVKNGESLRLGQGNGAIGTPVAVQEEVE